MTLEVKQLVVRGEIHSELGLNEPDNPTVDLEIFREELLEECRRMLETLFEQQHER